MGKKLATVLERFLSTSPEESVAGDVPARAFPPIEGPPSSIAVELGSTLRDSPIHGTRSRGPNKRTGRFVQRIGLDYGPSPAGFVRSRLTLQQGTKHDRLTLAGGRIGLRQVSSPVEPATSKRIQDDPGKIESVPPPRPVTSQIADVTVYQGQALVTREVSVPEGDGTFELVVTPMPAQTIDSSLYTEGTDGLRVLSTRFRTRAVKNDTRQEVRAKEEQLKTLQADTQRLQKEIAVQGQDLKYLQKLEGFTGTALTGLTEKGRLDSDAILKLSRFVMETRGTKTKSETDLQQQLQANTEAIEFTTRQLAELSAGSSRVERDAVIVVQKARPQPGTVRLGYLVGSANWWPQYRLRGARRERPRPARVPRRRGPADRRVLAGRPRHALHRPAVAGRRAARAAPAEDGRRGRGRHRADRGQGRPIAEDRRRAGKADPHVVRERDPAG